VEEINQVSWCHVGPGTVIWMTCGRVNSCQYHIRALRHTRMALSDDLAKTVERTIVITRIDYCYLLLFNQSASNKNRLQCLQNRLARTVKQLPFRSHVPCVRESLHWLPVRSGNV